MEPGGHSSGCPSCGNRLLLCVCATTGARTPARWVCAGRSGCGAIWYVPAAAPAAPSLPLPKGASDGQRLPMPSNSPRGDSGPNRETVD